MSNARNGWRQALVCSAILLCACTVAFSAAAPAGEELAVTTAPLGRIGGNLSVALRSEPKTLNPVLAEDDPSRDVIRCLNADLIHINRETLKTEPALAKSWTISADGKQYLLHLRHGVRF